MSSALPESKDTQSVEAIRELLKGYADYIEQKFLDDKAADIKPDYIIKILGDLKALKRALPSSKRVQRIQDLCYAAQTLYLEPQHRAYYFEHLRAIVPLLKRV